MAAFQQSCPSLAVRAMALLPRRLWHLCDDRVNPQLDGARGRLFRGLLVIGSPSKCHERQLTFTRASVRH